MAYPTVTVRLGLGSNALAGTPTWTDVSTDLLEFDSRRGRQYELDRFEPGEARVTLDNRHGNYWPDNTVSPYSPNVLPGVQLNLRAVHGGSTYDLFHGITEAWQFGFRDIGGSKVATVELMVAEATKVLARSELGGTSYAEENSGTRLANVLDTAGWPTNKRLISTGQSSVQASGTIAPDTNALDHVYTVAAAELGLPWQKPDMTLVWQDRHARLKAPYTTSQGTVGVAAGEWAYREPQLSYDDSRLVNDVKVIRLSGGTKTATDATSQSSYGKRSLVKSDVVMTTDGEAQDQADYLLARLKDPSIRITSIEIKPGANPDVLFPQVLSRDISDRVTISLPSGSVSADYFVEGVRHHAGGKDWTTQWWFSPATTESYWTLGVSQLGINTRLAY